MAAACAASVARTQGRRTAASRVTNASARSAGLALRAAHGGVVARFGFNPLPETVEGGLWREFHRGLAGERIADSALRRQLAAAGLAMLEMSR